MKTNFLLRAAVVASSVVLVGSFVCYRAGAFQWVKEKLAPELVVRPAPAEEPVTVEMPPGFFSGSKSGGIFIPTATVPVEPAPQQTAPAPTIIGGSKSAIFPLFPVPTPPGEGPDPQQVPAQQVNPRK